MAVYTEVSSKDARELLRRLQLGKLLALQGIEGGIENTNYFVTAEAGDGAEAACTAAAFSRVSSATRRSAAASLDLRSSFSPWSARSVLSTSSRV